MTIAEFYSELSDLVIGKFNNVSDAKKIRYVNRAVLNRFADCKDLLRSKYEGSSPLTISNGIADLPADYNFDDQDIIIYVDDERRLILPPFNYRFFGSQLRFNTVAENTHNIEYTKAFIRYTAIDDTFDEAVNARLFEVLQTEVEYLRDSDIRQGQITANAQSARVKTRDVS